MAPRLLNTFTDEASSNSARVEEVLRKKLRKDKKGSSQVDYGRPQDTRGTRSDGVRAIVARGEAEDERLLGARDLLAFERQGHLSTEGVLSEAQILTVRRRAEQAIRERSAEALQQRIRVLLPGHHQIAVTCEQQGLHHLRTHQKELGFLQHFNLHR